MSDYRLPLPWVLFVVPSFHRGVSIWGQLETRAGAEGWVLCQWWGFVCFMWWHLLGVSRCQALCKAYVQAGDRLPLAPRESLLAGPGSHLCQGGPDRPTDPLPSEVSNNWALEAGACQKLLSQNEGLLSLASF